MGGRKTRAERKRSRDAQCSYCTEDSSHVAISWVGFPLTSYHWVERKPVVGYFESFSTGALKGASRVPGRPSNVPSVNEPPEATKRGSQ
jgi:hypothetical protein